MRKLVSISNNVSTDTALQAFLRAFVDLLVEVGMVQTSDTGQLVPETAVTTGSGYLVFRMNDAMQGQNPIYIRFQTSVVGASGNPANKTWLQMTIGHGTDGAGNITDQIVGQVGFGSRSVASGTALGQMGAVHTDGVFAFFGTWRSSSAQTQNYGLAISRTCTAEGVATPFGVTINAAGAGATTNTNGLPYFANEKKGPPAVQTVNTNTDFAQCLLKPHNIGQSVSGEFPAYIAWHCFPEIMPVHGFCGVLAASMTPMDTFMAAIVGNTPRQYLVVGVGVFDNWTAASPGSAARAHPAILWE